MAEDPGDRKRTLEDLFANLQLRLINQKLADIEKEKEEQAKSSKIKPYRRGKWEDDDDRSIISDHPPVGRMDGRFPYRYGRPYHPDGEPVVNPMLHHPAFVSTVYPQHSLPVVPAPAPASNPGQTKNEMMEMMMLQGAQMHQSIMQQMMMSSLRNTQGGAAPAQPAPAPVAPVAQPAPIAPLAAEPRSGGGGGGGRSSRQSQREVLVPVSIIDILNAQKTGNKGGRWSRYTDHHPNSGRRGTGHNNSRDDRQHQQQQQQQNPNDPLIPLSLARELLQRPSPSVHHHHHGPERPESPDVDVPLTAARHHGNRPEVASRHAFSEPPPPQSPTRRTVLPPVRLPTWVHRPVEPVKWTQHHAIEVPPLDLPEELPIVRTRPPTSFRLHVLPTIHTESERTPTAAGKPLPEVVQKAEPKLVQVQEVQTDPSLQTEALSQGPAKPSLPFPGPRSLRRFRNIGYAVLFALTLRRIPLKKLSEDEFLMGIRLREMAIAVKGIYINPKGDMMQCLRRLTPETATDLSAFLAPAARAKDQKTVYNRMADLLTDMVDILGEIMPITGVLGIGFRSSIFYLVQDGAVLPAGYLWDVEEDLVKLDRSGRLKDIGEKEASVLLLGLLVGRGLIDLVLLTPRSLVIEDLILPNSKAANNMKLVASLLMVIVLEAYRSLYKIDKKKTLAFPPELAPRLYRREELGLFLDIKEGTIKKLEKRLREWSAKYYKRISKLKKK